MDQNEMENADVAFPPTSDLTINERPNVILMTKTKESDGKNSERKVRIWTKYPTFGRQMFSSLCGIFGSIGTGVTFGFSGTLLPSLRSNGLIDEEEGSWLTGINILACPIGIMLCSLLMPRFGRKACIIYSSIPWIIGWILMSTGSHFWTFLTACLLVGCASGSSNAAVIVYASEIPDGRLRGFINSIVNVFFSCGILLAHFLEIVFHWRVALALCALMPVLCSVFAVFSPETPNWLVIRGRLDEAEKNFYWLRGVSSYSVKEFEDILRRRENNVTLKQRGLTNLFSRKFWIPFRTIALMFFVQIFTGADLLVYYAVDALRRMSSTIDTNSTVMAIDIVRFAVNILSCCLIKKFNRRHLIFASCLSGLVAMIMIIATMHFHLPDVLLTFLICMQVGLLNLGIAIIPWIMLAEIFPQVVREVGSGIAHAYFYVISFVLSKIGPSAMNLLGMELLFGIFSGILLVGTILMYFVVPETQKLTLQEVEDIVRKKKQTSTIIQQNH